MKLKEKYGAKKLQEKLDDRDWRLKNLYHIKDKNGKKIKFKMNRSQKNLYDNLWFFNIVPKSRQLGITTFFCIFYLDQILFNKNKTSTIIAHTQTDMKKIFRDKIKFVWDNMDPWVKAMIGNPNTNTANELSFPNGSIISVALSSRSSTVGFLHVSEFGKICAKYPDKAEEIVTGAINSVHPGNFVSIESTAEGREGFFFDFCEEAQRRKAEGRELSPLDSKIHFYPWWFDDDNRLHTNDAIKEEEREYFETLKSKHGIELDEGQMRYYIKKKELNKDKVYQEYPSIYEEAFLASSKGAYYKKEMNRIYFENRIGNFPVVDQEPVETWWDLGMNDYNIILFVQLVGPSIRFVDCYYGQGYGLKHYVEVLREKGYRYSRHVMPHDIEVRDLSVEGGISRKMVLYNYGVTDIVVAPKINNIQDGIEKTRGLFSRFYFDEKKTEKLYNALANYKKDFDKKMGIWKKTPRKDGNDHFADAVRAGCSVYQEPYNFANKEEEEIFNNVRSQNFFD